MKRENNTDSWQSWNINGKLLIPEGPLVMGILNLTPDSFHKQSRFDTHSAVEKAHAMVQDGVDIIDIGGASSRPGSELVSAEEELQRIIPAITEIRKAFPELPISVDTWRAEVALTAVDAGASMINDISAGLMDADMFDAVRKAKVPYIMMHMQGTPQTMQDAPSYDSVVTDVVLHLSERAHAAHQAGISDVIIDPGFGFGKRLEHNYALLNGLTQIKALGYPMLVGFSRKSMIWKPLGIAPADALNGTTALNMLALAQGADILRVHDVKEAKELICLHRLRVASST